jgi:hypothetical protein
MNYDSTERRRKCHRNSIVNISNMNTTNINKLSAASSPDASCPTTRGREQGQRHERRLTSLGTWKSARVGTPRTEKITKSTKEPRNSRNQRGLYVHGTRRRGTSESTKEPRNSRNQRGLYGVSEGVGTLEDRRRMEEQGQKGTLSLVT